MENIPNRQRPTNMQNREPQRQVSYQNQMQRQVQRPDAQQRRPATTQPPQRREVANQNIVHQGTATHQVQRTQYPKVTPNNKQHSSNESQRNKSRINNIRNQKNSGRAPKRPSKKTITLTTLLLAGMLTITALTSTFDTNNSIDNPKTTIANTETQTSAQSHPSANTPPNAPADKERIYELDELNPVYEFVTWKGKEQLTIDDDSMKEILKLALRDAVDFYYEIGAPNCSFVLDENGNVTNTKGKENFLEKQMNWQYYMGRIYQEASGYIMIDFINDIGQGVDNPNGIFGSMPITTNKTLNEYFRDVFNITIDFAKYDSVITQEDVKTIHSSKETAQKVTEKVYNAALKVIIDDIHKLKSMTKGHEDCYLPYANMSPEQIMNKYNIDPSLKDEVDAICSELKQYNGKYSPTLALAGLQATHLYGFTDVRAAMKDGTYFKKYFTTEYIYKTFGNTDKIEQGGLFYE